MFDFGDAVMVSNIVFMWSFQADDGKFDARRLRWRCQVRPVGGGYARRLIRRRQIMPDPDGCYTQRLFQRYQVMLIVVQSKAMLRWKRGGM
jgi:hypothetical protein